MEESQGLQGFVPFSSLCQKRRRFRKEKHASSENQSEYYLYSAGNSVRSRVVILLCRVADHSCKNQTKILIFILGEVLTKRHQ